MSSKGRIKNNRIILSGLSTGEVSCAIFITPGWLPSHTAIYHTSLYLITRVGTTVALLKTQQYQKIISYNNPGVTVALLKTQ